MQVAPATEKTLDEQQVDSLLKKSVGRLHAVKDDLRTAAELDGDYFYLAYLAEKTAEVVAGLNRYVADREDGS